MVKVIRQTTTFRNQPIGLIQRSNAVEQSFVSTADSINQLNKIAFDELAANAKEVGEERARSAPIESFTTLDENGKFKAYSTEEFQKMGSIGKKAFEQLAEKRYMKSVEDDIKLRSKELRAKYQNTVGGDQAFNNAMSNYLDQIVDNSPDEFKNIIKDAGTATVRDHVADLTLLQVKAAQARNETMINNDVAEFIFNLETGLEQGNTQLISASLNQMDNIIKSAEMHEQTSLDASSKNYAQGVRRKMKAIGTKTAIASLYDQPLAKEEIPALNIYLQTGFKDAVLEANPELLSQASEVRTNMKYYEQEFVSNYSKKLAVAKNSIVANSDRSSSSGKNAEKDAAQNKIIDILREYKNLKNTSKDVFDTYLDRIVKVAEDVGPDILLSSNVESTYRKIMQGDVTENLTQEILSIKGVSSRDIDAISLYLTTGNEEDLEKIKQLDGSIKDTLPDNIKERVREIRTDLGDRNFLEASNLNNLREDVNQLSRQTRQGELLVKAAFDASQKKAKDLRGLEAAIELLNENKSILFDIDRIAKTTDVSQENIDNMLSIRDSFLAKIQEEMKKEGTKITTPFLGGVRDNIDKAITQATHNVMLKMVEEDLQSNVKMLVEVNGEFVVNPEIRKRIDSVVNYIQNPQNKEGVPEDLIAFKLNTVDNKEYYVAGADKALETRLRELQSEVQATAKAYQKLADTQNFNKQIMDRTIKSSEKTSIHTNDMLIDLVRTQARGFYNSSESPEQNLERYLLSAASLEADSKITNTMYKFIADGYLPASFIRILDKTSSLNNEQMGALITHVQRLQHGAIPGTNFKGSAFGYRGARVEGGDYKFKEVNDTINKLLAVAQISKLTGNVRETEMVSADFSGGDLPDSQMVEVTRSEPLTEIYKAMTNQSAKDLQDEYAEIRLGLIDYMPQELKNPRLNVNTDAIIEGLIHSADVFNKGNIPEEIKTLTDFLYRSYMVNKNNVDLNEFHAEYKDFLKDYVNQEYMESDGNILEFTNNGPKSFTRTRHGLQRYFNSPQKYNAAIQYINSILPEGFVFDPNTVMSDSFLRTYGDPREVQDPVTFTSSAQQKAYEALRATEAANKGTALAQELDGGRVILVAYPTASAQETVYQAFVQKNGRLSPVNVVSTEQEGEVPLVFSAQSLNNALVEDGVFDDIFEEMLADGVELRRSLFEKLGLSLDGQN